MNTQKPPSLKKIDQSSTSMSKRTVGSNRKDSSFQQAAVRQVLVSGAQSGDGLWCYQPEPSNNLAIIKESQTIVNQKVKQIEANIESEIVEMLTQQCQQLGSELDTITVQNQNLKIDIAHQNKVIDQLNLQLETAQKEIDNLRNVRQSLTSQCDTIKDLYNKTKRELGGTQAQLEQTLQDNNETKNQINKLKDLYREMQKTNDQQLNNLQEKLEELEEENEELRNRIQIRGEIDKKLDQERMMNSNKQKINQVTDNERKLEKMGKLLEENAALSEKLQESEILRRRFMEKNSQQEREIKIILESKIEVEKQIVSFKKRVNDLQVLKSTNQKILEEKINKLSDQLEQQIQMNNKLQTQVKQLQKRQKVVQQEEQVSDYEDVEAKPQLFGA